MLKQWPHENLILAWRHKCSVVQTDRHCCGLSALPGGTHTHSNFQTPVPLVGPMSACIDINFLTASQLWHSQPTDWISTLLSVLCTRHSCLFAQYQPVSQLASYWLFVLVYDANQICFSVLCLLATQLMGRGVVLRPLAQNFFRHATAIIITIIMTSCMWAHHCPCVSVCVCVWLLGKTITTASVSEMTVSTQLRIVL